MNLSILSKKSKGSKTAFSTIYEQLSYRFVFTEFDCDVSSSRELDTPVLFNFFLLLDVNCVK